MEASGIRWTMLVVCPKPEQYHLAPLFEEAAGAESGVRQDPFNLYPVRTAEEGREARSRLSIRQALKATMTVGTHTDPDIIAMQANAGKYCVDSYPLVVEAFGIDDRPLLKLWQPGSSNVAVPVEPITNEPGWFDKALETVHRQFCCAEVENLIDFIFSKQVSRFTIAGGIHTHYDHNHRDPRGSASRMRALTRAYFQNQHFLDDRVIEELLHFGLIIGSFTDNRERTELKLF